jgi:hypothetical protein
MFRSEKNSEEEDFTAENAENAEKRQEKLIIWFLFFLLCVLCGEILFLASWRFIGKTLEGNRPMCASKN